MGNHVIDELEGDIKTRVVGTCRMHPIVIDAWDNEVVGRSIGPFVRAKSPRKSQSDVLGMIRGGIMFGFEVKKAGAKKQRHEAEQNAWMAMMRSGGGLFQKVESEQEAAEWLNRWARR